VGAAPPYEATRTRVAMLQFRASVSRAERDVRAASIRLRQLVGRPDSSDTIAIIGAPVAPAAVHAPDLSALQTLALQHRADLQASRLTEARSRADLLLQLAVAKVDLTWGAEYRRQSATAHSNSVGLFFSVPLPVHNRNQGEIARSEAAQQQAGREISAVEAAIRADVRSAFDEFASASALVISIEQDLLALAMSARDTAAYAYRAGGSTLVELLDSQRAWNDTMQSYQQAQADYHRAIVRLNSAVGMEVIR
jgi:cobalt-zinc-cadmium efflux system outer membrane protein